MRSGIILLLLCALAWFGWRLADVERQRYALATGLCQINASNPRSIECLRGAEPRESWLWNLYHGLVE
ncbi:hypothetical protein KGO5_05279 [Sinorhizobium sp. KGO-5]|nr:hypothetical protein CN215_17310 [Sinorhizobium meliloti]GCA52813.1 hypothetical protein KGO5_05279 [Sinorhizobium sp. KGO-5]